MLRNADESANRLRQPIRKSLTDLAHEGVAIFFAPLVKVLQRLNISPNAITVLGFGLSLVAGAFLALGYWRVAIAAIVISGMLDGVDGLLARQTNQTTPFGAFLDSVLDRWSDSAFFLGLLIWYSQAGMSQQSVLAGAALASSLLVSYTRARAEGIGAKCSRGLFTRLERFIALVAGLVLKQMTVALWAIAVLSTLTALQRIYYTWKHVKTVGSADGGGGF
jgi:CDP-diacylglycerol--glycerol-3-phosphate 3-phosphatidyltransferase